MSEKIVENPLICVTLGNVVVKATARAIVLVKTAVVTDRSNLQ